MPSLKKYFLTGLLILVPVAITIWVIVTIVATMDLTLSLLPDDVRQSFPFNMKGAGVVLTLAIILIVGMLGGNFIGRRLMGWWDAILRRIPVVSFIYTSVKQVSDTLFSPSGQAFRKAVLIQFPREGTWSVAFVVGSPGEHLSRPLGTELLTVYVPTAPNPTSGYVLMMPPEQVLDLDITVDDALKFVVSMGVLAPSRRGAGPNGDAALPVVRPASVD